MPCHCIYIVLRNPILRLSSCVGYPCSYYIEVFAYAMIMHRNNRNIKNPLDSLITYLMHTKVVGSITHLASRASFKLVYPYVYAMLLKCHASYLTILVCSLLARDFSVVIVVSPLIAFPVFTSCVLPRIPSETLRVCDRLHLRNPTYQQQRTDRKSTRLNH